MIDPRDIERVRELLAEEVEMRRHGGERKYLRSAEQAQAAFERIVKESTEAERAREVAAFDEIWTEHA